MSEKQLTVAIFVGMVLAAAFVTVMSILTGGTFLFAVLLILFGIFILYIIWLIATIVAEFYTEWRNERDR